MISIPDIIVPVILAIAFVFFIVGVVAITATLEHDLSKPSHKPRRTKNYHD